MEYTLVRVLAYEMVSLPVLSNMLNDDRFFKNKILLVELSYYTKIDCKRIIEAAKLSNYIIADYSNIYKLQPLEFVGFFAHDKNFNEEINTRQIQEYRNIFRQRGPNFKQKLYKKKIEIMGYLTMLYFKKYIFISTVDRFIETVDGVHPIKHIEDGLKLYMFKGTFFKSGPDSFAWSGNLSNCSFSGQYKYNGCMETGNVHYIVLNKNKSLLQMNKLIKKYINATNIWLTIDVLLKNGKYDSSNETEVTLLNYSKLKQEHLKYKEQRNAVLDVFIDQQLY